MSKKKLGLFILALSLCLSMRIPVLAQENVESIDKSERMQNKDFENIIVEIQNIKSAHPEPVDLVFYAIDSAPPRYHVRKDFAYEPYP